MRQNTPRSLPLAYEVLVKTFGTSEKLEPIQPDSVFQTLAEARAAEAAHRAAIPFRLTMRIRPIG